THRFEQPRRRDTQSFCGAGALQRLRLQLAGPVQPEQEFLGPRAHSAGTIEKQSSRHRSILQLAAPPANTAVGADDLRLAARMPANPKMMPVPISVSALNHENQVTLMCGSEMKLSW